MFSSKYLISFPLKKWKTWTSWMPMGWVNYQEILTLRGTNTFQRCHRGSYDKNRLRRTPGLEELSASFDMMDILFSNALKSLYCEFALSQASASGPMLRLGLCVSSHQPVNTHVFATQICQDHQCPTALIYSVSGPE